MLDKLAEIYQARSDKMGAPISMSKTSQAERVRGLIKRLYINALFMRCAFSCILAAPWIRVRMRVSIGVLCKFVGEMDGIVASLRCVERIRGTSLLGV